MNTPNSFCDLLSLQPPAVIANTILEKYLHHHPNSEHWELVERAIASDDMDLKTEVMVFVCTYG